MILFICFRDSYNKDRNARLAWFHKLQLTEVKILNKCESLQDYNHIKLIFNMAGAAGAAVYASTWCHPFSCVSSYCLCFIFLVLLFFYLILIFYVPSFFLFGSLNCACKLSLLHVCTCRSCIVILTHLSNASIDVFV